ncbi:MAG: flagellar hook-associated protein FlgK [Deltaproteobacteria bacterium]|nr:flagellar hook-associated protein FlgK [Deltaproteobacteria bacterium]MBW1718224.1 flagellar hook-associated protein FlgK [Deltaproteobacteria bacterium]
MSSISLLNTARDGLLSHRAAINLTGSNITNVNTPGYTRQLPVFSSLGCVDIGAGRIELSVGIEKIERVYDRFLGVQINDKMNDLGYSEAKKGMLEKVEIIFNESSGGGINELLSKFWSSWEDLSANPTGQVERDALVSASQNLASIFRSSSDELVSVQNDANTEIRGLIDQANFYISDLADLNHKIAAINTGKGDANDLRDKRDEALKGLAEIFDFQHLEDSDGSVSVFLPNGMPLVMGDQTWELDVKVNPAHSSFYDVIFQDDPLTVLNDTVTKGKLAGFLEIRDEKIANYLGDLNSLAASIIAEVNTQHQSGYDMDHNLGGVFFEPATEAKYMQVSTAILADVNKIAVSETVNGDGGNAELIATFKDELFMNSGTSTFNGYYASFVGKVGQDLADEERGLDHNTNVMNQLINKREGISGVSIDEEMTNLIKYQLGYNAAARLCNVADELLDTLLNMAL